MAQLGQRKCLCCAGFFLPDHRNRKRQRYCSAVACRRASKSASQAAWLSQADNAGYFRGPVHVARVQAWRAEHPGYSRGRPRRGRALQETSSVQVPDPIEQSADRGESAATSAALSLQDHWTALPPALAGLIAHVFELTLQEDIAATVRRLVQLGDDVIKRRHGGQDDQARAAAAAVASGAAAVQLD